MSYDYYDDDSTAFYLPEDWVMPPASTSTQTSTQRWAAKSPLVIGLVILLCGFLGSTLLHAVMQPGVDNLQDYKIDQVQSDVKANKETTIEIQIEQAEQRVILDNIATATGAK